MPNPVTALVVRTDGSKEQVQITPTLDALQAIVGGYIEFVPVSPTVHLYCNEEGKLDGLPFNPVATDLANHGYDPIVGDVVFLGEGVDGDEGDLPAEWLRGL